MPSFRFEDLSPFGRLAVELDGHFVELARLSGQLERLDIESDSGLAHAIKLLGQFADHGQKISGGIQGFAQVLQEARARSEAATQSVAERAQLIQQRKQKQNEIREKLAQVERHVKAANENLLSLRRDGKSELTQEERLRMRAGLERLNEDLKKFLVDAQAIKEAAGRSNFKAIEHDAKNLLDALKSSSRKIGKAVGEP